VAGKSQCVHYSRRVVSHRQPSKFEGRVEEREPNTYLCRLSHPHIPSSKQPYGSARLRSSVTRKTRDQAYKRQQSEITYLERAHSVQHRQTTRNAGRWSQAPSGRTKIEPRNISQAPLEIDRPPEAPPYVRPLQPPWVTLKSAIFWGSNPQFRPNITV